MAQSVFFILLLFLDLKSSPLEVNFNVTSVDDLESLLAAQTDVSIIHLCVLFTQINVSVVGFAHDWDVGF